MFHKNIVVIVVTLLFISLVKCDDRPERVNKLFEKYNKEGSAGLTISIIQNGKFVHQKAFGLADVRHRTKNTLKTRFLIASISKQFSCLGMAQ